MLNKILGAALILVSANAFAGSQTYTKHSVELPNATAAIVTLSTVVETTDGCNTFGIDGRFYAYQLPSDEFRMYQPYVGDVGVVKTEMGCDELPQERKIPLSAEFTFQGVNHKNFSGVYLELLVPSNMTVSARAAN